MGKTKTLQFLVEGGRASAGPPIKAGGKGRRSALLE